MREGERTVCFHCERDITEEMERRNVCVARIIELGDDEDTPLTDNSPVAILCVQCGRENGNRVVAETMAEEIQ